MKKLGFQRYLVVKFTISSPPPPKTFLPAPLLPGFAFNFFFLEQFHLYHCTLQHDQVSLGIRYHTQHVVSLNTRPYASSIPSSECTPQQMYCINLARSAWHQSFYQDFTLLDVIAKVFFVSCIITVHKLLVLLRNQTTSRLRIIS